MERWVSTAGSTRLSRPPRCRRLLPGLRAAGPPAPWLGFRPAVEGSGPRVERFHDTRLWLAYGHFRNGILLAPATALRIASSITGASGTR